MIELRWLEQKTGKRLMNDWGYYYDETTKVLQWRTQVVYHRDVVNATGRAASTIEEYVWTDWRSVPIVQETS
jgi:hypothetical protein